MHEMLDAKGDRTFIRVAEVWNRKDDRLVLENASYGDLLAFAETSRQTSFGKGEGLPGRVWAEERPIVLQNLDDESFVRSAAATQAGLTSAVAIPVFADTELKAVLLVLCSADAEHSGAIEIWEEHDGKLLLDDGYYGHVESFAAASREISFAYGQGLPGGVWVANAPMLMRDLGRSSAFVRAQQAAEAKLTTGLGLPIPAPRGIRHILTLLSAPHTPIARRFELWDARPQAVGATGRAVLIDGICEREGPLWSKQNPPVDAKEVKAWNGPVGRVLGSGRPYVQDGPAGLPADYTQMVALPIYNKAELAYLIAWYL